MIQLIRLTSQTRSIWGLKGEDLGRALPLIYSCHKMGYASRPRPRPPFTTFLPSLSSYLLLFASPPNRTCPQKIELQSVQNNAHFLKQLEGMMSQVKKEASNIEAMKSKLRVMEEVKRTNAELVAQV